MIECNAFENCTALEALSFPATLECIGILAFSGTSLKRVDLSQTALDLIIWEAFANNPHLEEVRLPATCTFVGEKAFANCDSIRFVVCDATVPPLAEHQAFTAPVTEQATLVVPDGSEQAYRTAEVWKEFAHITTPTALNAPANEEKVKASKVYDLRGLEKATEKGLYIKDSKLWVK